MKLGHPVVLLAVSALALNCTAATPTSRPTPSPIPAPTGKPAPTSASGPTQPPSYTGVWGTSKSDVFIVGTRDRWHPHKMNILHYDGQAWTEMKNPIWSYRGRVVAFFRHWFLRKRLPQHDLCGIWGSSHSDVFAVGTDGLRGVILHYDGSEWSLVRSGIDDQFTSVWGQSWDDVFAVGMHGTILHYNGQEWTRMNSGVDVTTDLRGVWGSSGKDVFAVGVRGTILHYDGHSWRKMNAGMDADTTRLAYLWGVWGTSPGDVYVTGGTAIDYAHPRHEGILLHYDGNRWNRIAPGIDVPFYGIWGSSASDIFIAIYDGKVLRYDGKEWTIDDVGVPIGGVWGLSSTDVYFVGPRNTVVHYVDGNYTVSRHWQYPQRR